MRAEQSFASVVLAMALAVCLQGVLSVKQRWVDGVYRVTGTLDHVDDFSVSLRDPAGEYHSFLREGDVPKVEIRDPLRPHSDLLRKYSDANIHDVTAYLVSLK